MTVRLFQAGASTARFDVYLDNGGEYRWRTYSSSER